MLKPYYDGISVIEFKFLNIKLFGLLGLIFLILYAQLFLNPITAKACSDQSGEYPQCGGTCNGVTYPNDHTVYVIKTVAPNCSITWSCTDQGVKPGECGNAVACNETPREYPQCGGTCNDITYPNNHTVYVIKSVDSSCNVTWVCTDAGVRATECGNSTPTSAPSRTPIPTISPTSNPNTSQSPSPSPTITPQIISPLPNAQLSGVQKITVRGYPGTKIDLQIQPKGLQGSVLLSRITIDSQNSDAVYSWDTTNTPNGEYSLYALMTNSNVILGPVKIYVANQANGQTSPIISTSTKTASGSAEVATSTQTITFPKEFNPEQIKVDTSTAVKKIENTKTEKNIIGLSFEGAAKPNTIITLLIFSNPIVVTVRTDSNGLWKYTLEKPLNPGEHSVYAVLTNSDGSKIRSDVTTFLIKPAQAAASDNNESLLLSSAPANPAEINFILVTSSLIISSIICLVVLYLYKRRPVPINP